MHLAWIFHAWTGLESDQNGAKTIWTSGKICLDELRVESRDERLRWLGFWQVANEATQEVWAAEREKD